MASYTEETLTKGETILLKGKIALRRYWLNFLFGGVCLVQGIPLLVMGLTQTKDQDQAAGIAAAATMIVVGILLLIPPILRVLTNELVLTNKRVVAKIGIISLDAIEIKLEKVESVSVKQGILGKLLNYGTIIVAGTGATHAVIPAVTRPVIFKRQFNSAVESLTA